MPEPGDCAAGSGCAGGDIDGGGADIVRSGALDGGIGGLTSVGATGGVGVTGLDDGIGSGLPGVGGADICACAGTCSSNAATETPAIWNSFIVSLLCARPARRPADCWYPVQRFVTAIVSAAACRDSGERSNWQGIYRPETL